MQYHVRKIAGGEPMVRKCRYFVWLAWKKVVIRPVLSILLLLAVVYVCAIFIVMAYEEVGFDDATAMILPTLFGELGVMESPFLPVRISIVAGLVASVTFVAIITAKITSTLIEFLRRGGSMKKKVNFSGHIMICGWNFQGERIVNQLLSSDQKQYRQIVVLANIEQRPVKDERIEFIKGDPTQDESLVRAGVMRADSVIVLTDLDKGPNEADAEALMTVLAVESLNRKVHTCVQLLNSANRTHLERAHADEIICLDQLGGNLVVASALNHGLSNMVSELLTFNVGSEFYRYGGHISDALVGREFAEAVQVLAQRRMILLAVETDCSEELRAQLGADIRYDLPEEERVMVVNPQSQYKICQGDALFVIAESQPTEL
ncbi:MAG: NAD(P)-binding protein [Dehalococcoidia bacterium]